MNDVAPAMVAADRLPVVGIGASAGGLEALRDMLGAARLPTGMAFVVVQHLDPNHESMLAQLLDRHTVLAVHQCEGGERLAADRVYIIPPGRGLAIRQGVLELTDFAQPRGLRRPIDDFFLSLASDQQALAACVILSGTGADGTTGLRAVKENGGVCIVQQPETARYDGMPLSAVGTGLVDFICPSGDILECLRNFFARKDGEGKGSPAAGIADHVDDLCRVLRGTIGHDFAGYKRSTLIRRVERRMHVLGITAAGQYLQRLRGDAAERGALFRDLLINVTRFFRDAELFEMLRARAIEPMLRREPRDEEDLRVWVPGCSSGEEAYSIAMLFAEVARSLGTRPGVQIFATDIDEQMLQIAREGTYPASALADIPAPLRERYAMPHGDRFSIAGPVRDLIRFSNHSLVKDPPFSRIDLLSCRNLLIYFGERLQQSVLPLLHYALKPGGVLFLGPSESVGRFEHLFPPIDQHARLFLRSPGAPSYPIDLPGQRGSAPPWRSRVTRETESSFEDESAATRRLLERYAPPSLVVDQDGGILAAHGRLSRYFNFPVTRTGGSSITMLARPGLRDVLGPLLRRVREERKPVRARDVTVSSEFGQQPVEIVCDPLGDGTFLFVIRDTGPFARADDPDIAELDLGGDVVEGLEEELRLTRHRLRSAVEELETANEELKSSNEEMMSMNEELQSTNEELATVNDELKSKVDQLTVANSDLRNFLQSTELAVIVVDPDLRVRSFTEAATAIFPLQPSDKGRPLGDVSSRLGETDYLEDARTVALGGPAIQRRVVGRDGRSSYALRILPYRSQSGLTQAATLVLTDITEALTLERALAAERQRLDLAITAGGIGIWEYSPQKDEVRLDPAESRLFDLPEQEALPLAALLRRIEPEDRDSVTSLLERTVRGEGDFAASFRLRTQPGSVRWIKSFGRLTGQAGAPRILGVSIDVTAEYALSDTRELMLREMNHRVKNLFAIIGGMVTAAARSHQDVGTFALDLRERVVALGQAHSLASPIGEDRTIGLADLIDTTLAPYRDHAQISVAGPDVLIDRGCLSPLALMLHEWATNSVKYGALGAGPGGSLALSWRVKGDGLVFDWREESSRIAAPKPGTGFGTLLVETSSRQLGARVNREARPGYFALELILPRRVLIDA
ncbi:chemotaxis protein CheB [Acidisoma sp. C75]